MRYSDYETAKEEFSTFFNYPKEIIRNENIKWSVEVLLPKNPVSKLIDQHLPTASKDIQKKVVEKECLFSRTYHTRANLLPIPHGLNSSKGASCSPNGIKDMPDHFLKKIKDEVYPKGKYVEPGRSAFRHASDYFKSFSCWKTFIEENHLKDFFEVNTSCTGRLRKLEPIFIEAFIEAAKENGERMKWSKVT